jgi:hypothetical protein
MACEYASSDQDAKHVISANAVYMLPFGKGQPYLNHGFGATVLGGLSLDSIFGYRSGLPINVVLSRPQSAILDGNNTEHTAGQPNLRPNLRAPSR